ncbi:serine/threonine-protein kinase 33-like [Schistocerca gregaria]|uniref:serine/threonine-protein kinase 33-like n=1 Tax=Schistocerca gregaria TaxID=7010 RepID=UPI00211DAD39|nr:serine/threonine-protein kinase 33-like [Schistocerca gregaria]
MGASTVAEKPTLAAEVEMQAALPKKTPLPHTEKKKDRRSGGGTRLKERPMLIVRVSDDEQLRRIYDFGDELGRGRYGVVVQARARLTRMSWAIKVINKSQAKYPGMKLVDREIRILRLITHPNIIHLEKVYESPKKLYLVFELCSSTLAQEFSERRQFTEADAREVIRKLASAVAYLHRNGIVHRDLKLENILLTTNPADPEDKLYIKVTDFGQSVVRSGVAHDQMLHERCGTMAYMAPEVLESRMYSHQCDVWSMGVITFVLLVGEFPFTGDNPDQLKQRVLNDEPLFVIIFIPTVASIAKSALTTITAAATTTTTTTITTTENNVTNNNTKTNTSAS